MDVTEETAELVAYLEPFQREFEEADLNTKLALIYAQGLTLTITLAKYQPLLDKAASRMKGRRYGG